MNNLFENKTVVVNGESIGTVIDKDTFDLFKKLHESRFIFDITDSFKFIKTFFCQMNIIF